MSNLQSDSPADKPESETALLIERLREAEADYTIAWDNGDLYEEAADRIKELTRELAEANARYGSAHSRHAIAAYQAAVTYGQRQLSLTSSVVAPTSTAISVESGPKIGAKGEPNVDG